MSEQQYMWMLGLIAAWRQQIEDHQDDPSSRAMDKITGVSGSFRQYEYKAANELAATLLVWVFIYAWNCAKQCAISGRNDKNRAINYQNNAATFLTQATSQTRTIQRLAETLAFFCASSKQCQMNSPLTGGRAQSSSR